MVGVLDDHLTKICNLMSEMVIEWVESQEINLPLIRQ